MSGLKYYIIDTETTGLSKGFHEVNEISIIRCEDKSLLWKKIKCMFPERASLDALRITNKTMEDLSSGDSKQSVVELCNKFLNEDGLTRAHRVMVAHNAPFDRKFVHSMWGDLGLEFPANLWLDTMALTRQYAKDIGLVKPKVNLHASCDIMEIKKFAAKHNAKDDTKNTFLLYKALIDKVDYLPFIKTEPHNLIINDDYANVDDLD